MKKLSLVLVLAMVFSFMAIGTVSAANKYDSGSAEATTWAIAEGWNAVTTVGGSGSTVKKANVTNSKGGEAPATGKYFLALTYEATENGSYGTHGNIYALSDAMMLEDGAEYTINYSAANADGTSGLAHAFTLGTMVDGAYVAKYTCWVTTLGQDGALKDSITTTRLSGQAGYNKWANYETKLTYDASVFTGGLVVAPFARWNNYNGASTSYWDNFSVVKAGTTENLVKNGDFEPITYALTDGWMAMETVGLTANMPKDVKLEAVNKVGNALKVTMGAYEGTGSNYWNGNGKALAISEPVALAEGTEYTVSYYRKGDNCSDGCAGFWIGDIVNGDFAAKAEVINNNGEITKVNSRFHWVEGQWKLCTYKFTYTEAKYGKNPRFAFGARFNDWGSGAATFYFDEISVKATGSNVELLSNGSFDGVDKVIYRDAWDAGNGWKGELEYVENNGRFEAVVAGTDKPVYNGETYLGSANLAGDSGLYVSYEATANAAHCGNYNVYSPVIPFEAGKEYNISYLARQGDTGYTDLRWYVGTMANGKATPTTQYLPWTGGAPSTGKGNYVVEINLPFTAPADASNLRFIIQLIRPGYKTKAELSIDNFVVTEKATGKVIYTEGFGADVIEIADPTVTLGLSSDLGAYELVAGDDTADGKATYKVVINTVPFGRKAVITANGEVITADTEYVTYKDVEVVVAWEDDGTDVLNELATAYEAEGEAAVFAKFNGTMPENYGFIIDAFVGKKFTDGTNEITDGKFAAADAVNGVFGIRIAGVEAGAYSAVPYAGEATADAIAFNIQ